MPWVGCLVLVEAQEVTFQALLRDLQIPRDVLSRWKACYNAEPQGCNGQAVNSWARKVADDREYVVGGKAGSQRLRNAFLVKRALRSRSPGPIQARRNEEGNVMAAVAIREEQEVGHPT